MTKGTYANNRSLIFQLCKIKVSSPCLPQFVAAKPYTPTYVPIHTAAGVVQQGVSYSDQKSIIKMIYMAQSRMPGGTQRASCAERNTYIKAD